MSRHIDILPSVVWFNEAAKFFYPEPCCRYCNSPVKINSTCVCGAYFRERDYEDQKFYAAHELAESKLIRGAR